MKKNVVIGVLVLLLVIAIGALAYFLSTQEKPPIEKSAIVEIEVQASPSFNLEVNATHIITFPNRTIAFNAILTPINNFAGEIIISVSGLPPSFVVEYFPTNVVALGLDPKGVQINITIPDDENLVGLHTATIIAHSDNYN